MAKVKVIIDNKIQIATITDERQDHYLVQVDGSHAAVPVLKTAVVPTDVTPQTPGPEEDATQ